MTRAKAIPETITVHVPFRLVKRGGRKEMVLPPGAAAARPRSNSTLIKAMARAFRWKKMLESGEFATIGDLANRESITPSYMTRLLRLTLLAPDIVEEVMAGAEGTKIKLAKLMQPFPVVWAHQRS